MIILIILIAIVIGFIIAKYYKPKSKSEKIWASILIPLVSGILIHLLVAACRNSGYGFAFDLGATIVWVAIPEVFLLITLFIKLKPDDKKSINIESQIKDETFGVPLHYGTGENRVDFELQLTKKEILKIAELRRQDPDKWDDDDLELVKAAKNLLQEERDVVQETEGVADDSEEVNVIAKDETINAESVMEPLNEEKNVDDIKSLGTEVVRANDEVENKNYLFGNKLESEYRREAVTDAHRIKQNGKEICLNIDEITYKKMVELQNEAPKRWIDKELDLFLEAKKMSKETINNSRKGAKWLIVLSVLLGIIALYGIVAATVDYTIASCDENTMTWLYQNVKEREYINCSYTIFRYRMIANTLYRKKIYNLWPYTPWPKENKYTKEKYYDKKASNYDNYYFSLRINNWLENPFVWLW